MDGLQWYCENCSNLLYEEFFPLTNIETQFQPVIQPLLRQPVVAHLQALSRRDGTAGAPVARGQWLAMSARSGRGWTSTASHCWPIWLPASVSAACWDSTGAQLRCFNAPAAISRPLQTADFTGRVDRGGSCNCNVLTMTPHANGTHTECVGHLTPSRWTCSGVVPQRLLIAAVLTVEPELAGRQPREQRPKPRSRTIC